MADAPRPPEAKQPEPEPTLVSPPRRVTLSNPDETLLSTGAIQFREGPIVEHIAVNKPRPNDWIFGAIGQVWSRRAGTEAAGTWESRRGFK